MAVSLLFSKISTNRNHWHAVTIVGGVLDIDKCGYQTVMKHWQQDFVVPEFVKAAVGVKIMAVLMKNII